VTPEQAQTRMRNEVGAPADRVMTDAEREKVRAFVTARGTNNHVKEG
jgi:hypothetical protein